MSAQHLTLTPPHASQHDYAIGLVLSIVLTAVPFWLVMTDAMGKQATGYVIMVFAAVQMIVHVVFFLHVRAKSEKGWTLVAMIFAMLFVCITLSGSLWVMHHLDSNMMPAHEISQLP